LTPEGAAGWIDEHWTRLSAAAGYDVVLSNSRGPQTLKDLVDELDRTRG
jgi:hypothetical protein